MTKVEFRHWCRSANVASSLAIVFFGVLLAAVLSIAGCGDDSTAPEDPPPPSEGEWETSSPEEQGLNSSILNIAVVSARDSGFMDCLLVVRNGYIVTEEYFNGYDASRGHNVKSVSKSFLSAMVGIAVEQGYFSSSLNQTIAHLFSDEITDNVDPRIFDITLRHLLTMRAGFDTDRNTYGTLVSSSNWIRATLHLYLLADPGDAFRYNTFSTHLLATTLARATEMTAMEFGKTHLFDPLKIECTRWDTDPQGNYFGGNNMYFKPRDAARFGQLCLNGGSIDGEQILPEGWVEDCTQNSVGGDWIWGDMTDMGYGRLFWTGKLGEHELYTALGHGGQYIMVLPELEMIVVTNSVSEVSWEQADQQERAVASLVKDYVLTAITE
jgi:CubicO group peptidase (beta-lactamase class C family)